MALFMRWFGEKEDELGCTLNGSFITSCTGQRGENATPFLHKAKGTRLLWLSEVPQHDDLPMTVLKPFAEQQGATMSSRALHRAPESWRPMALAVLTSNFPMKLSERQQDDDGAERRLVPYFCKHKFVARPELITHRQADPMVHARIAAGEFNAQLTALFVALEPTLGDTVCPKNEIEPEPEVVRTLRAEAFGGGRKPLIEAWLDKYTEPCRANQASPAAEIKKRLAEAMGISVRDLAPLLTAIGISPNGENAHGARGLKRAGAFLKLKASG
jgi:hypothetical protein